MQSAINTLTTERNEIRKSFEHLMIAHTQTLTERD
jgi:hypothetical protein